MSVPPAPTLTYDKENHIYRGKDGSVYRSVTQRLGDANPFPRHEYSDEDLARFTEARDAGSRMHNDIDTFIKNQSCPLMPTQEFLQWKQWHDAWKPRFLVSEHVVCYDKKQIAGTIDAIFEKQGKYYIVDWKRTTKLCSPQATEELDTPFGKIALGSYAEYQLQISLYAYMWQATGGQKLDGAFLVACHPNLKKAQTWEVELRTDVKDWFEKADDVTAEPGKVAEEQPPC